MTILHRHRSSSLSAHPLGPSGSSYLAPALGPASSSTSSIVDRLQEEVERAHWDSAFLGLDSLETFVRLRAVADEAAEANWDGYGAFPADPRACHYGWRFAALLGRGQQPTDVSIDPDGEVSLDWDRGVDAVVSVSVSGFGRLAYAARLGASRSRGVEHLSDGVPEQILSLIRRVGTSTG